MHEGAGSMKYEGAGSMKSIRHGGWVGVGLRVGWQGIGETHKLVCIPKCLGKTKRDCDVVDFMSISLMTGEAVH